MNETEFWQLIEKTKFQSAGDGEKQAELLVEYLSQLSEGEILDFDSIFSGFYAEAYNCELWGAAYLIEGGCSDDGFMDFRAWLISRGINIYEAALANPESLVDVVEVGEYLSEAINHVAMKAYRIKVATDEMPFMKRTPPKLKGEWIKEEDLPTVFPKLYAKFTPYWDDPDNWM